MAALCLCQPGHRAVQKEQDATRRVLSAGDAHWIQHREEEEQGEEAAAGSLAKAAGSIHSHSEFNILMRSWNRRSNKRERLRGWVGGKGEREGGRAFSIMKTGQKSLKQ